MKRRGHTLNELMVAVSLSVVLMSLIFGISVGLQGSTEKINRKVDQSSAAQAAVDLFRFDVELAGHRWGTGGIARAGGLPGREFCSVSVGTVPATPVVGMVPGHQQIVLRSDRFPARLDDFRVGQRDQVPDGRIDGLDEEVVYAFERYDEARNLWRLRRAYRTGDGNTWQCMTLLENLVIPNDGAPFRYDVLVQRGGQRAIDRHLKLENPVSGSSMKPFGGAVGNQLFEINGQGGIDLLDFEALTQGSLLAGVHLRFCVGDGRDLPNGDAFACEPEDMRQSSPHLRLVEIGLTAKNVLTWRAYLEGRRG